MPRPANPQEPNRATDYLTFFIAGEEYGVPILRVREILQFRALTRVPAAPPCVRGVINLRGSVVPVADLAIQFRQPECAITKFTCVVVVEVAIEDELAVMGLMVDSVNQTVALGEGDIEATPTFGTLARPEYLLGMGRADNKFILLLDIDRALSSEALEVAHARVELPPDLPEAEAAQDG
ncbi:MAG TPA: chemotaxis protein CheW [Polyangiales bacterium]|nr:chemotaxis protein CheW [Polyangiales bacterium]